MTIVPGTRSSMPYLKDLKLIESSAKELGISTLGMPEVIAVYEAAVQQGLAKTDIAAIAEVLP